MTAQTDAHFVAHNPHTNGIDLCALAIVHGDLVDMRAALERGKGFRTYEAERKMRAVIAEVDAIKMLMNMEKAE